jgi:hypothetical protein
LKVKWSPVFPNADFSLLGQEIWFFSPSTITVDTYQESFKTEPWKEPFGNICLLFDPNLSELVQERIGQLKEWIKSQPAKEVVLVGHSAYFKEWLNAPSKMPNCHIHTTEL